MNTKESSNQPEGVRACGTCGARFGEEPDAYQIETHTRAASPFDRAAAVVNPASQTLTLQSLGDMAATVPCPALRAVLHTALGLLIERPSHRPKSCPVVPARRRGRADRNPMLAVVEETR